MRISFLEPHPTHPSSYIPSGRGGAGNLAAYTPSSLTHGSTATGPASLAPLLTRRISSPLAPTTSTSTRRKSTVSLWSTSSADSADTRVSTGRGGAGNAASAAHRGAVYDFEGEVDRARHREGRHGEGRVYVGRGGAGNVVKTKKTPEGGRALSVVSAGGDGWRGRVARAMGRE